MAHRLAPRAVDDLDEIWLYVAQESGNIDIANRLIDTITERFLLLASFPYMGRSREEDFGPGYRSFPVLDYVILYYIEHGDALILRVVHGRRKLEALFGH
jgi:toxin ParE1/3/4